MVAAAGRAGTRVRFASRSDSTLRGHYPLETDVITRTLAATTGETVDAVVIVPAFPDAGRVTVGGVHYVRSGGDLVPVADTEFAHDATFGYTSSRLAAWVEEKTAGARTAEEVLVLDLAVIRAGASAVALALEPAVDGRPVVADATSEDDLRLLSLGLIEAERRGKRLLYRVGPPFVRARIGQEPREPLRSEEVFPPGPVTTDRSEGGLVVVGSHVGLTSRQLRHLLEERPGIAQVEIDVPGLLGSDDPPSSLRDTADRVAAHLATGDVVLSTSRLLSRTDDPQESLGISRRVSAAVVAVVRRTLELRRPRYVVAKGGITSSDVAAHGLGIRHAVVRGPMLPGIVSLWEPVDGPAVGIPFVVFAGNVGDDASLAAVVDTLSATTPPPGSSP